MKVLLVRPPTFSKSLKYPAGPRFGFPLSLLYLAAILERENIHVSIYDALIDFNWHEINKNKNGYYHIGAPWSKFIKKILEYEPDIIGITNQFSDYASYAIIAAEIIKNANNRIISVIGGPHPTSSPISFFTQTSSIDYVVRGEGEITFLRLLNALNNQLNISDIPGITYKNGINIKSNSPAEFIDNLDDLPLPAYHLIPMEEYFKLVKDGFPSRFMFEYPGSEREVSIITSRGCPYRCVFCGNHIHMGRRWRYHSVNYILRHMDLLISQYGVKHFHIEDDNIALNIKHFEKLLDGIHRKGWDITWDTPNGVRADGLKIHILQRIKESCCTYLIVGIESGNQKVLNEIIKKNLKLNEVHETVKISKKLHLDVHGFYVVGFPGERYNEIVDTFKFAKNMLWKYDIIPHLCLARPLPGTELFKICEKNGYLTKPIIPEIGSKFRTEVFPRIMIKTEDFGPEDLEKWVGNFNKQIIIIILLKTILWLFFHPQVIIYIIRKFRYDINRGIFDALKRIFFGGLFFKFNYLNKNLQKKFKVKNEI